jgi:lysophospholipase L1-like esterase
MADLAHARWPGKGHMNARTLTCLSAAILCTALAGCSDGGPAGPGDAASNTAAAAPTEAAAGLRLVSLGDSSATGSGDEDGIGWVQRYADLVSEETGSRVQVIARAQDGTTSDALVAAVTEDDVLREQISTADIVVIGAGGADLNKGDDDWNAGVCSGPACYEPALAAYERNVGELAAAVAELRADEPTIFRAVTPPNGLTGAEQVIPPFLAEAATEVGVFVAESLRASTCAALRAHGGECIDVLTAFNGSDGTEDAYATGLMNLDDCCYASGKGQQVMAELLLETGVEPQALS